MPVWLLEHKDPIAAQGQDELFERMVIRARDEKEARDLAIEISPIHDPDQVNVWGNPGKTYCDPAGDGDSRVLACEQWGSPRTRPAAPRKSPAG